MKFLILSTLLIYFFDSFSQENTIDTLNRRITIIKAGCATPYACAAGVGELSEENKKKFKEDSRAYLDSTGTACEFILTTNGEEIKLLSLEFGGYTYKFGSNAFLQQGDTAHIIINEKKKDNAVIQNKKQKLNISESKGKNKKKYESQYPYFFKINYEAKGKKRLFTDKLQFWSG